MICAKYTRGYNYRVDVKEIIGKTIVLSFVFFVKGEINLYAVSFVKKKPLAFLK